MSKSFEMVPTLRRLFEDSKSRHKPAMGALAFDDLFGQQRTLTAGNFTQGGALIATDVGDISAALRPSAVAIQAGARVVNVRANQAMPFVGSGTVAAWLAQGEAAPETTMAFGQTALMPRRIGAVVRSTRELLMQTDDSAESAIRADLLAAVGQALTVATFSGLGGAEPIGLGYVEGIASPVTFGGPPTLADFSLFEKTLADNFAEKEATTAFICSTGTRSKCRQVEEFTGGGKPLWTHRDTLSGKPAFATGAIADDRVYFGSWLDLLIVVFGGGAEILVNPFNEDGSGIVRFTLTFFADLAPLRTKSFLRSTDSGAQ